VHGLARVHSELVTMAVSHQQTVLWLIRHPEPAQSVRGVCYGSLDVPLSAMGMRQADEIAQALESQHFDMICSSPSQRCMHTASKIAWGRPCAVQPIDAIRELHFGAFEGRSYAEIAAHDPELYCNWMERPTETQFPSGETFSQMSERVIGMTHTLLAQHEGRSIVFITHGGPIRVIIADALGLPMRNIFRIGQRHGAVNRILYWKGSAVVDLMNASFSNAESPNRISEGAQAIPT
jgi:alpha-ribazole phosphatase